MNHSTTTDKPDTGISAQVQPITEVWGEHREPPHKPVRSQTKANPATATAPSSGPTPLEDLIQPPIWALDVHREWLVEPILERGVSTVLAGDAGGGKSFVVL